MAWASCNSRLLRNAHTCSAQPCGTVGALFAAGSDLDGPQVVDFIDGISTRVALMEALHLGKVGLTQAEMQLMPLSDLAQAILDARCAASGCSLEKPPPTTAR